jgi:hypothetical protein
MLRERRSSKTSDKTPKARKKVVAAAPRLIHALLLLATTRQNFSG